MSKYQKVEMPAPASKALLKKPSAVGSGLLNRAWSSKRKERFYSDLHNLMQAHVDLKTSLEILIEEQTKDKERDFYINLKNEIVKGANLSEALKATGKFSEYEYYSLKIGEESGRTTKIMHELASYYDKKIQLNRQLAGIFSYPAFVLVFTIGVLYFMLTFVVPMFSQAFTTFGGELPKLTLIVIDLSDWVASNASLIFMVTFGSIFALYSQRKTLWFRKFFTRLILGTPLIGKTMKKVYLARYCQSMELLLNSGTPLIEALRLVERMIGLYPLEVALEDIKEKVLRGAFLYKSMREHKIFESKLVSLVRVGESTNQLGDMFKRISKQYNDEVDYQTKVVGNLLQPIMIVFIGALVGVVFIAMYLPMVNVSQIMNK